MTSPSAPALPCRRLRASSLRADPNRWMAAVTRAAVSCATPGSALTTRETVFRLTPAVLATSRIVGRPDNEPLSSLVTRGVDNVVSAPSRRPYPATDIVVKHRPDDHVAFRSV